ncbi:hypothetical protein DLE01_21560, partial [Streptomyces sp. FT05W]
ASTIAGSGAASDGANKGVAPAADLIVGKVLITAAGGGVPRLPDLVVRAGDRPGLHEGDEFLGLSREHPRAAQELQDGPLRVHHAGGVQRVPARFGGVDRGPLVDLGPVLQRDAEQLSQPPRAG